MEQVKSLKRLFDVSTTLTGIGMRVGAQEYLGMNFDENAYAQKLRHAFGNLKGPFMKMVQFLATVPDALPPEFATEFLTLQSNAPSMGEGFVRRRMAGELGINWRDLFQDFSLKASHAASLGQVHQAVSKEGVKLAIKLQYPDMETTINADLKQLNLVLGIYQTFNKSIDTQDIADEIRERLHEELDYIHEAQNLKQFREIFKNTLDFIVVPEVYPEFSTRRLLTMEWMEGKSALDFVGHANNFRDELGRKLFLAWYWPLYRFGILHGDPHPGNYLILSDERISVLDFGCVRKFDKLFLQAVVDLYVALRDNKPELAVDAYRRWGFKDLNNELIEVLNQWAKLLYDPLLEDKKRPIQEANGGKKGWKIARSIHKQLHDLGGIKPPREFVFMDRAAVGIGSVLMRLESEQNWHRLFEEIIDGMYTQ
ncbi:MAG: AarF/ABC1/UbiB kinase family protein [Proteobacteria bacterium]|nr:AarF/ABC1/UbiB kinase family protein [Pseudomonadota bacterium]